MKEDMTNKIWERKNSLAKELKKVKIKKVHLIIRHT